MRKIVCVILFAVIVFSLSTVSAGEVTPQSLFFIQSCQSSIAVTGSGNLAIAGWTLTSSTVDQIRVVLCLQYWNGSRWVDYLSWGNTQINSSYISNYIEVIPPSGVYYRVRGEHYAKKLGITEKINTVTPALYYVR